MTVTWLFIIFWPWVCFVSQVNWPEFVARNTSGSLKVEPESSLMYSSAVVFSRVRTSSVHLKSLGYVWIHLTLNFFFLSAVGVWRCERHGWADLWPLPSIRPAELHLEPHQPVRTHGASLWHRCLLHQWLALPSGLLPSTVKSVFKNDRYADSHYFYFSCRFLTLRGGERHGRTSCTLLTLPSWRCGWMAYRPEPLSPGSCWRCMQ